MTITLYCFRPVRRPARRIAIRDEGHDASEDGRSRLCRQTAAAFRARRRANSLTSTTMATSSPTRPSSAFISKEIRQGLRRASDATSKRRVGWAIEKMCEEHLYWIIVSHALDGRRKFRTRSGAIVRSRPRVARPLAKWFIRRKIAKSLWAQGMGRHSAAEVDELGVRDIEALSTLIGDKPYLFGDDPLRRRRDGLRLCRVASVADGGDAPCATRRSRNPISSPIATG